MHTWHALQNWPYLITRSWHWKAFDHFSFSALYSKKETLISLDLSRRVMQYIMSCIKMITTFWYWIYKWVQRVVLMGRTPAHLLHNFFCVCKRITIVEFAIDVTKNWKDTESLLSSSNKYSIRVCKKAHNQFSLWEGGRITLITKANGCHKLRAISFISLSFCTLL